MNLCIFIGRLTKEPTLESSTSGKSYLRNSIAVDRRFKTNDGPTADFFDFTAFNGTAEFIAKFFKKGSRIVLVGEMQNDSYTNKEGKKVTTTKLNVEKAEFAESKSGEKTEEVKNDFLNVPDGLIESLPFS